MPHEQYTPAQKEDIEDSRAVYKEQNWHPYETPEQAAKIENEFRGLLKKRGVEIPDIDLICEIGIDDDGSIIILTVNRCSYSIDLTKLEGRYWESDVKVETVYSADEESMLANPGSIHITKPERIVTGIHQKSSDRKEMNKRAVESFIRKYQPRLLAEVYGQALYNISDHKNEVKHGDLSW